ncbi:MAG TPA: hypothetical protein ENN33_03995 [Ignavibacteria bacterium]|nr:hypothetical protein [Ignavibacteria bacterium]
MKAVKKKDILAAIEGTGGVMTVIASKMGISRWTVANCRDKWEEVRKKINEEREKVTDKAEWNIMKCINEGDIEISKWWLKTIGSHRGFIETQKHDVETEENVIINFRPVGDGKNN